MEEGRRESFQPNPSGQEIWRLFRIYFSRRWEESKQGCGRALMRLRRIWNEVRSPEGLDSRPRKERRLILCVAGGVVLAVVVILLLVARWLVFGTMASIPTKEEQCRERLLEMPGRCGAQVDDVLCLLDSDGVYPTYYFQLPITITPSAGNVRELWTVERDEWCPRTSVEMLMDSRVLVQYHSPISGQRETLRLAEKEVAFCLQWLMSINCKS
jgi:hypothetical protein